MDRKEIHNIAQGAASKVLEGQTTCISAGITLFRDQESFRKATPIIFRVNLKGLVSEDDLKVPHSELALSMGAAGKDLIAFAFTGIHTGIATYDQGEGKCGTIFGREDELFKPALAEKVNEMWEKRGPGNPGNNPGAQIPTKYLPCPICLAGKEKPRYTEEGLRYHLREFHKRVDVDELVKLAKEIAGEGESNPGEYVTITDPGKTTFKVGEIVSREAFDKENERVKRLGETPATGTSNPGEHVTLTENREELIAKLERGESLMCSFNGATVEAKPWSFGEGDYSVVVKRGRPGVEDRTFTNNPSVAVDNFIMLCR